MPERILLLTPPSSALQIRDLYCSITSKGSYYWPPIDLLTASGLLNRTFELAVVDAVAQRWTFDETLARVKQAAPAGILAMAGSASWSEDAAFFRALKKAGPAPIVVTGDISVDPEFGCLEACAEIDAVWTDFTSPGIAAFFRGERPAGGIAGMAYRTPAGVAAPKEPRHKTFHYPIPRHDLFPLDRYRLPYVERYPFSTILTNYGCPFTCSYCIQNHDVLGHRRRPVGETLEELRHLASIGIREAYFRDPLFESNRSAALELCAGMLRDKLGLRWSCNCRIDTVDEELLTAMRSAGCSCIAFGFESANESLLRRYSKKTTLDQARRAVSLCRERGILVAGYFILGLPGETYESALETIEFAAESGIDYASFAFPSPDYGTRLRRESVEASRISRESRPFNRSLSENAVSDLSADQLARLRRDSVRRFYLRPGYILKTALRTRSLVQLRDAIANCRAVYRTWSE